MNTATQIGEAFNKAVQHAVSSTDIKAGKPQGFMEVRDNTGRLLEADEAADLFKRMRLAIDEGLKKERA